MNFHVGQKVVCVADAFPHQKYQESGRPYLPVAGVVYTVRASFIENFVQGRAPAVHLVEIINPQFDWSDGRSEIGFGAWRFRPVVDRTDGAGMTILRKIADDASRKVKERV